MSFNRKRRRELLKKAPKLTNENADKVIAAVNQQVIRGKIPAVALMAAREQIQRENVPELQGYMLLLALSVLHLDYGWSTKRLTDFIHKFNDFGDQMMRDKTGTAELKKMLEQECRGLDIKQEFAECEAETAARKEKVA